MSRPRIGLDIDGVVYKWSDTVRYLVQTHHGIDVGESTYWDYLKDVLPPHVWRWLWREGIELGLFRYGHLYRGAIEGVRELAAIGKVEAVTHRPEAAVEDTLRFLSYIELPLSGVHILTEQQPKSSVGCDVYIDDAPHVAREVVGAGKRLVLVDQPWNADAFGSIPPHPTRAMRAFGWANAEPTKSIPYRTRLLLNAGGLV